MSKYRQKFSMQILEYPNIRQSNSYTYKNKTQVIWLFEQ